MIEVRVRAYATLRDYLPGVPAGESSTVAVPEGTTIAQLADRLGIPAAEVKTRFVNGVQRDPAHRLQPGDEVAFFPPIGGG